MLDEADKPLSAVLLSLSGERQYRSNNVTGSDGHMAFLGLVSPFFLKIIISHIKSTFLVMLFSPLLFIIIINLLLSNYIYICNRSYTFLEKNSI